MHGKVDPELAFSGPTLVTRGPINWAGEPGDGPVDRMRLLDVTVTQGDRVTVTPNTDFTAPADHWTARVRARSGTWAAGTAEVSVRVRLWPESLDSSPFEEAPWVETVKLVPA